MTTPVAAIPSPDRRVRWLVTLAGVGYAGVASLSRPLTAAAALAVASASLVVLALAVVPQRPRRQEAPRRIGRTAVAWGGIVALAATWEIAAWLQQPAYNIASHDHPTVSLLLDPGTEAGPARFVAWCGWLWLGYRLVRR